MDVLPGLRPANPAIEAPKPSARTGADESRDGARFEERLNQAREQAGQMNESSRAEESASRVRAEAEPAKASEPRDASAQVASDADVSKDSAADSRSEASNETPRPANSGPADRTRPDLTIESAPLPSAAIDGELAAAVSIESPMPSDTADAAKPLTPAQLDTSAIAGAISVAVRAPQTTATPGLGAAKAILGVAIEPKLAGEAPDAALAIEPTSGAKQADLPVSVAPDTLARATPTSPGAAHDFAGDLAQLLESTDAKALQSQRATAASDSAAEILRQVRVGLSTDLREASIQLAPEALGRVWIRLRVEHGALTADVRAETAQALRALEMHAPELKAALAQHGIEPRDIAFSFMNSHAGDAPGRGHAAPSRSPRAGIFPEAPVPLAIERALARRLSASGVDTYA